MKEDYLWDKSGHDPEIEELENALSAFRWTPAPAPKPVVEVTEQIPERVRRWFGFSFGFSFAAAAVLVLIFAGIWFMAGTSPDGVAVNETPVATNAIPAAEVVAVTPAAVPADPLEPPAITKFGGNGASREPRRPVVRKPRERTVRVPQQLVALSAEEQEAYGQLMLALSITGSKLKIVKDKVEGTDHKSAVTDSAR